MKRPSHYRHGVPPNTLHRLERILATGAAKHGEPPHIIYGLDKLAALTHEHIAAARRHLRRAGKYGDDVDRETFEPHLLHAAARLILLATLLYNDQRIPRKDNP